MKILIASKKSSLSLLQTKYPGFEIIDVTSRGQEPFVKFSPFYPHGGIPVPFSDGYTSFSVEGIWQGLKVFENEGIDVKKFQVQNMKGIKRAITKAKGKILGHQMGIYNNKLIDYLTARLEIYLPSYQFVVQQYLQNEILLLKQLAKTVGVVLLDFETNGDINNLSSPLSHAALIKQYIIS
jgi:hypothetical protein